MYELTVLHGGKCSTWRNDPLRVIPDKDYLCCSSGPDSPLSNTCPAALPLQKLSDHPNDSAQTLPN